MEKDLLHRSADDHPVEFVTLSRQQSSIIDSMKLQGGLDSSIFTKPLENDYFVTFCDIAFLEKQY
jgi:hypothetical protein